MDKKYGLSRGLEALLHPERPPGRQSPERIVPDPAPLLADAEQVLALLTEIELELQALDRPIVRPETDQD